MERLFGAKKDLVHLPPTVIGEMSLCPNELDRGNLNPRFDKCFFGDGTFQNWKYLVACFPIKAT